MSIVASIKVHDGLVLGAESMTQIYGSDASGRTGVIKAYQNAQKLFQVADRPIGVMTYGLGNIGARSLNSFISEFSSQKCKVESVEGIANELFGFLRTKHHEEFGNLPNDKQPGLGVFVGGYSPDKHLAEEWEFSLPSSQAIKSVRDTNTFGASWRGIATPFTRLYRGLDPGLQNEIIELGLNQEQVASLRNKYMSPIVFPSMPVQDAIEFAVFVLQTTINMAKFEVGVPTCGGPLWIAVITTDGFRWVEKPELKIPGKG